MKVENDFNKALRYLDIGSYDKAIPILNHIIEFARKEAPLYFIKANCVLGEVLFSLNEFEQAGNCFHQVIATEFEDDRLNYEKDLAKTMIERIKKL